MGRVGYAGTLQERMARKCVVDPVSGCWNWRGAKDTKGYGQLRVAGKNRIATHIALELAGKPRTPEKPCALHTCDNPSCVNPDHLWWGTFRDNTRDMMSKGRGDTNGLVIGHELARARRCELPIVKCAGCGLQFTTSKARFKNNFRHFCSTACCWRWQSEHFTGCRRAEFSGAPCRAEIIGVAA